MIIVTVMNIRPIVVIEQQHHHHHPSQVCFYLMPSFTSHIITAFHTNAPYFRVLAKYISDILSIYMYFMFVSVIIRYAIVLHSHRPEQAASCLNFIHFPIVAVRRFCGFIFSDMWWDVSVSRP
jgi:hypothetical protein